MQIVKRPYPDIVQRLEQKVKNNGSVRCGAFAGKCRFFDEPNVLWQYKHSSLPSIHKEVTMVSPETSQSQVVSAAGRPSKESLATVRRYFSAEGLQPLIWEDFTAKYPQFEAQCETERGLEDPPSFREIRRRYDARAEYFDEMLMCNYELEATITAYMLELCRREAAVQIVDAGCGTGLHLALLAENLPSAQIQAYDLSPGMVAVCQERLARRRIKNAQVLRAKHVELGRLMRAGRADCIIVKCSIDESHCIVKPNCLHEHCHAVYQAVRRRRLDVTRRFAKALRPGGILLEVGMLMPQAVPELIESAGTLGFDTDWEQSWEFAPTDRPLLESLEKNRVVEPFIIALALRKRANE